MKPLLCIGFRNFITCAIESVFWCGNFLYVAILTYLKCMYTYQYPILRPCPHIWENAQGQVHMGYYLVDTKG